MALARVVSFEGVDENRMREMEREMREGERPESLPASDTPGRRTSMSKYQVAVRMTA